MRVAALALLLLLTPAAAASQRPSLDPCGTLEACLALFDRTTIPPGADYVETGLGPGLAARLSPFGEPAKQALFRRMESPQSRALADLVLGSWRSWSEADLPAIRRLMLEAEGNFLAQALPKIGGVAAREVALEAFGANIGRRFGVGSNRDRALLAFGPEIAPGVLRYLHVEGAAGPAIWVMEQLGEKTLPYAPQWAATAIGNGTEAERVAALRALSALGPAARPWAAQLHPLLASADARLKLEAERALFGIRDPIMAPRILTDCGRIVNRNCFDLAAAYGDEAQVVAPQLLRVMEADDDSRRMDAAAALGAVHYRPALPKLIEALLAPDWRMNIAAATGLGLLGERSATPSLQKVAAEHWHPNVRRAAAKAAAALASPAGRASYDPFWRLEASALADGFDGRPRAFPPCPSQTWRWRGERFAVQPADTLRTRLLLDLPAGRLLGSNFGEFGGRLSVETPGSPRVLLEENVVEMRRDGKSAIVLTGVAHMVLSLGAVYRATPGPGRTWTMHKIGELPGHSLGIRPLRAGAYATFVERGPAVVFSNDRILGVAACETAPAS